MQLVLAYKLTTCWVVVVILSIADSHGLLGGLL